MNSGKINVSLDKECDWLYVKIMSYYPNSRIPFRSTTYIFYAYRFTKNEWQDLIDGKRGWRNIDGIRLDDNNNDIYIIEFPELMGEQDTKIIDKIPRSILAPALAEALELRAPPDGTNIKGQ